MISTPLYIILGSPPHLHELVGKLLRRAGCSEWLVGDTLSQVAGTGLASHSLPLRGSREDGTVQSSTLIKVRAVQMQPLCNDIIQASASATVETLTLSLNIRFALGYTDSPSQIVTLSPVCVARQFRICANLSPLYSAVGESLTRWVVGRRRLGQMSSQHMSEFNRRAKRWISAGIQHLANNPSRVIPVHGWRKRLQRVTNNVKPCLGT